jgi:hypothetical protein
MHAVNLVVRTEHRRHGSLSSVISKQADESRGWRGRTLEDPAITTPAVNGEWRAEVIAPGSPDGH